MAHSESDEVFSVRGEDDEYGKTVQFRIGPYFSIQSARNQASRARRRGATILGIDSGTVTWKEVEK